MNTIESTLVINGTILNIGDKVKIVNEKDETIESVFRKVEVSEDVIELWFSKNNFSAQSSTDKDYDVMLYFIWLDDIDRCINEMNLQIIK